MHLFIRKNILCIKLFQLTYGIWKTYSTFFSLYVHRKCIVNAFCHIGKLWKPLWGVGISEIWLKSWKILIWGGLQKNGTLCGPKRGSEAQNGVQTVPCEPLESIRGFAKNSTKGGYIFHFSKIPKGYPLVDFEKAFGVFGAFGVGSHGSACLVTNVFFFEMASIKFL